ncbi:MAG: hypothetical protein WAN02_20080 [Mycobacterium sp.]
MPAAGPASKIEARSARSERGSQLGVEFGGENVENLSASYVKFRKVACQITGERGCLSRGEVTRLSGIHKCVHRREQIVGSRGELLVVTEELRAALESLGERVLLGLNLRDQASFALQSRHLVSDMCRLLCREQRRIKTGIGSGGIVDVALGLNQQFI